MAANESSSSLIKEKDEADAKKKKKIKTEKEKIVDYNSSDEDTKDFKDVKPYILNTDTAKDYYCSLCRSQMNSDLTWETHINGKRHIKKVQSSSYGTQRRMMPADVNQTLKYSLDSKMIDIQDTNEAAQIQDVFKNCDDPIVGLDFVREIWPEDESAEPHYICLLCKADCQRITIFDHVIGYRHRLNYLQRKDLAKYNWFASSLLKKSYLSEKLAKETFEMERNFGRGFAKVAKLSENYDYTKMDFEESDDASSSSERVNKKNKLNRDSKPEAQAKKKPTLSAEIQVQGLSASTIREAFENSSYAERIKVITKVAQTCPLIPITDKIKDLEVFMAFKNAYVDYIINKSKDEFEWLEKSYNGDFEWSNVLRDKLIGGNFFN